MYNSRQHAPEALFRLLEDCPAKFILLSYSSEGFINYEEMTGFLGRLGRTVTLETPYAAFPGQPEFQKPSSERDGIPVPGGTVLTDNRKGKPPCRLIWNASSVFWPRRKA